MTEVAAPPVISPCKSVCTLNVKTGYCLGCWRTAEEIGAWYRGTDDERRQILAAAIARKKAEGQLAG